MSRHWIAWIAILSAGASHAADFTVNSVADTADQNNADLICDTGSVVGTDAECTLRAALESALVSPGADEVRFAIPGAGPHQIDILQGPLPLISQTVVDGYTQPGAAPPTGPKPVDADIRIHLRGQGLRLDTGTTVTGLAITDVFSSAAIVIEGGSSVRVIANYIGLNPDGSTGAYPSNLEGVVVLEGIEHRIAGNAIANAITGVRIGDTTSIGIIPITIEDNLLGLDPTGQFRRDRLDNAILSSARRVLIQRNVVAGSFGTGVSATGREVEVRLNYIGTDITGLFPHGNALAGVELVGDDAVIANNVIGANLEAGIRVGGENIDVLDNIIGLGADELTTLNNVVGVQVRSVNGSEPSRDIRITNNTIANNEDAGVRIAGDDSNPPSHNIVLRANRIFDNFAGNTGVGLGIDLGPAGVTLNDTGDGDNGANGLINFPTITNASLGLAESVYQGAPDTEYTIEYFANDACDLLMHGEGQYPIGASTRMSDGAGLVVDSTTVTPPPGAMVYTATATGPEGTSEFSACFDALNVSNGEVNFSASEYRVKEGDLVPMRGTGRNIALSRTGGSNGAISVDYTATAGTASGADFAIPDGTATFADGIVGSSFFVGIADDMEIEPEETVLLTLSNPQGGATLGPRSTATLIIEDNDIVLRFVDNIAPGNDELLDFAPLAPMQTATASVRVFNENNFTVFIDAVELADAASPFVVSSDNCTGINLPAGANCTFDVIYMPVAEGVFADDIVVTASEVFATPDNRVMRTLAVTGTAAAGADLALTLAGTTDLTPGGNASFTIEVLNGGPLPASGVVVVADVGAEIGGVTASPSLGAATVVASTVTWNLGQLGASAPGDSAVLTLNGAASAMPADNCTVVSAAVTASSVPALNTDDDTASLDVGIGGCADVAVLASFSTQPNQLDPQDLVISLTVTNHGPTAAADLMIDGGPAEGGSTVPFAQPLLAPGESFTVTGRDNSLQFAANNTAVVSYDYVVTTATYDPSVVNNTADGSVTVSGPLGGPNDDDGPCFIATAAYGSPLAPEVQRLRDFRDRYMMPSAFGRWLVGQYYTWSPPLADLIARDEALRAGARAALWPLIWTIKHPIVAMLLSLLIAGVGCGRLRRHLLRSFR